MRLYVHFEPSDETLVWTKRLNLPPLDDPNACPSVRSILHCFFSAYNAKFRSKTPPEPENVDVFVEFHQNAATRRLLDSLDVSVAVIGSSVDKCQLMIGETCDFELVVTPKEPQRKVLGPEPPPALKTKKKATIHTENNNQDGRDPGLCGALELAAAYMKQRKFRAARELYSQVVMKMEPQNPEALVALGDILAANGRHEEAVEKYYLKCWKMHGGAECGCKAHAKLVFTSALRLAECYIQLEKFVEAVLILDEVQTFVRVNSGNKAFFSDTDQRLVMEEQMDVLKAQALYETKDFDNQEKAISLVMHLLPDLSAPTLNLNALLLYAKIAHVRSKKSEALSMALRALVGKSDDPEVKKTLVSLLKEDGSMERLKSAVPPISPSAGSVYAFIATILKEFGVMEKSIMCYQQAQASDSQSASYALNHAHALEACCRYADAYDVLVSFFRRNCTLSIGSSDGAASNLVMESFVRVLDQANVWQACDDRYPNQNPDHRWHVEWISECGGIGKVIPPLSETIVENVRMESLSLHSMQKTKNCFSHLSEAELDLLACCFTVVKILFINGQLSVLPSLIHMLEPLRIGRNLHRTTIRNEQAYYACITQLLSIETGLVRCLPQTVSDATTGVVYVCGDSHTLATAWRTIDFHGQSTLLRPALVTGLKHWHLRKESTFYPKLNFWCVVDNIPRNSRVIFLFGEIDCREGILDAVEKCKYETVEEGMNHTIGIFMDVLADVVEKYAFEVFIHPVVPVLDETRHLVIQYNKLFRKRVAKTTICK
ncbi:Hypothetical protein PHPALM_3765 [Phytophthora palmivora]|uniref:Uncharacterized protein n=1 Tax=Phytophthora palmivora TaxID=4796 RepID=A0A2P4YLJ6_9STRA|nr:Hypothetical protein PHPALM_3765 [Phytophthora palmivora]